MPSVFKKTLEATYGGALFITALTDEYLQIYPLQVWEEIETRINARGKMNPLKRKFLTRANRYGTEVEMDSQGRIHLKPGQRGLIGVAQEMSLIGCTDHLELWPGERLAALEGQDALTADDFEALEI